MISQNIILGAFGAWEWVAIAVVVLLLFGGKKIPELMKGLGGGLKEFKKAAEDEDSEKPKEKVTEKNQAEDTKTSAEKEEDPVTFKEKK